MKLLFIIAIAVLLVACDSYHKERTRLAPAKAFVERFLRDRGRIPTQDEFRQWGNTKGGEHGMFTLRDHTDPYAAKQGAKGTNDYMVGTWRADWYYYYKSWDKQYLDGSTEFY